ncbi:MAG: hypothetical protein K5705_01305 [Oscillospiraceae bacterium]|nr:hypothetical protein [Oscillospiraceae bacterium]
MIMKMSMLKKIAVCASAGAVFASFSAATASAANDDYAKINPSSYAAYTDSLTKADKIAIAAKEADSAKLAAQKKTSGKADADGSLPDFHVYTATAGDPVAAAIYSALMYIVKSAPSQATIANTVKNDFAKIPAYMNARQSQCRYVLTGAQTLTGFRNKISYDINNAKVPTFLRLSNLSRANWYYAASSTCALVIGISADKTIVRIADPLSGRLAGCPSYFRKSAAFVNGHTTNICW